MNLPSERGYDKECHTNFVFSVGHQTAATTVFQIIMLAVRKQGAWDYSSNQKKTSVLFHKN